MTSRTRKTIKSKQPVEYRVDAFEMDGWYADVLSTVSGVIIHTTERGESADDATTMAYQWLAESFTSEAKRV